MARKSRKDRNYSRKYRTFLANEARAYRDYVSRYGKFIRVQAGKTLSERDLVGDMMDRKEFSKYYRDYAKWHEAHGGRYSNARMVSEINVRATKEQLGMVADFFTGNESIGQEGFYGRRPSSGEPREENMFRVDDTFVGWTRDEFLEYFLNAPRDEQNRLLAQFYAIEHGDDIGYGNEVLFKARGYL